MLKLLTAPLSAHVQPQVQIVDVGKEASFQCITSGHPQSRVTWLHNGKPIARDDRIEVSSNPERLRIKHLQKEDHGMYQCFVSNEWDQAQAIAELDLGGKFHQKSKQNLNYKLKFLFFRRESRINLLVLRTNITTRTDGIVEMCSNRKSTTTIYLES